MRRASGARHALILGAGLLLGLALPAAAQPAPPGDGAPADEARLSFKFKGGTIDSFLGYLSQEAGFTFIIESGITGDISAIAERPMTRGEALEVLRAWLLPKERTLLRTGNVVRIVTLEEAKRRGLPVRVGSKPEEINDNEELITQVMPLRYVQASQVKEQLEGLLSDQGKLMIEPTSNALVVRDTSASIRRFAEVLVALDQAVTSELQVKVYRLEYASAEELAGVIDQLFSEGGVGGRAQTGGGGGRGGRGGRGGMRDMARMFFGGRGGGGRGGGNSGSAAGTGGAQTTPVQVTHDARTNAVVVTATTDQIRLVDSLVAELDRDPDPIVTEIRTFPLANADATALAETINELFEEDDQSSRNQQNLRNMPGFMRRMMAAQGNSETTSDDRYAPKPRTTVDERTNTLIVSAVPADLGVIAQLVEQLDKDPTETSSVWVATLRNANAENLANILGEALSESAQTAVGGGNQGRGNQGRGNQGRGNQGRGNQARAPIGGSSAAGLGGLGGLVGEVTVVADPEANALIFTTSPRNVERLRGIVAELDLPRREVFIECLIAEVQLSDQGELGIQWQAMMTNSIENDENGTQTLGTDFGLDALGDGLRYTTTSGDLTGLLRALRTEGRLNILSSPKILVLENAEAEISVGQEVPFVTNSRITQNGDTTNTIQYRDVGIILRVEPQVNDDGYVRLVVHPEVSSIAPDSESVPISDGVRSPTFNRNFADTTIVIGSGETAVIGGMIQDTFTETRREIPLIGEIPIIGRLFGSTIRQKAKQEIVVFLTPHVIENAGQLRANSRQVINDYAMVPPEVLEAELDRWTRDLDEDEHPYVYNRGTVLLESGRIVEAIGVLEQARDLRPDDAATRLNLGLALARAGAFTRAEVELGAAERLDPSDAEIPYNLGAVYWRVGNYPQAVARLRRALYLDPAHEDARRWLPRAQVEQDRIERELLRIGPPASNEGDK